MMLGSGMAGWWVGGWLIDLCTRGCWSWHHQAVNSKPRRGDERPNAPDSWTYRVKNALLFQPELEQVGEATGFKGLPRSLRGGGSASSIAPLFYM